MNNDPPGDPVVYALWRAWRWLRDRPTPTPTRLDIRPMPDFHLALHVGDFFAVAALATADPKPGEIVRPKVPVPEPIEWTVSDPLVASLDQLNGTSTTIYGAAPGTATVAVKAGPLTAEASITVAYPPATRLDIVPWDDSADPPSDPTTPT